MREPHVFKEKVIRDVPRETPVERVRTWRKDNHDRYNEYQREYMREYRAGKRRR